MLAKKYLGMVTQKTIHLNPIRHIGILRHQSSENSVNLHYDGACARQHSWISLFRLRKEGD